MDLTLLITLFGIAILDSINPSAIVITVAQLSNGKNPVAKCLAYIFGIYITYFFLGTVLYSSYSAFGNSFKIDFNGLINFINQPPIWAFYLQLVIGISLIIYSIHYFRPKIQEVTEVKDIKLSSIESKTSLTASFLLGITVTGVEAFTALPYFGAISTLYISNLGFFRSLILLIIYNIIFILPPLILVLMYKIFTSKFEELTIKIKSNLGKYTHKVLKYGFIILGIYLSIESTYNVLILLG